MNSTNSTTNVWIDCECGNSWQPRKPLREIEELRCSNCDTLDQDAFNLRWGEAEPISPVESAASSRKKHRIMSRLLTMFDEITEDVAIDSISRQDGIWQCKNKPLVEVSTYPEVVVELLEFNAEIPKIDSDAELDEIEKRLDDLSDEIEGYLAKEDNISRLQEEITELEQERDAMQSAIDATEIELDETMAAVAAFEEEHGLPLEDAAIFVEEHEELVFDSDFLEARVESLERRYDHLTDKKGAYWAGFTAARDRFAIPFQCTRCFDWDYVRSGTNLHQEILLYVQLMGPTHQQCE